MKALEVFDKTVTNPQSHPMQRPRISTNLALSADGKLSSPARIPSGWTSAADKQRFMELRKGVDAILVGRGTLEADRMTMTGPGNPLRCIVSRTGSIRPDHPIFSTPGGAIHLLMTGTPTATPPPSAILHRGDLADFLSTLAVEHGVRHLHCEGGGELIRNLAELDVIDEFHATLAGHTIFGGADSPTATGVSVDYLPATRDFSLSHFEPDPAVGECFVTYTRNR